MRGIYSLACTHYNLGLNLKFSEHFLFLFSLLFYVETMKFLQSILITLAPLCTTFVAPPNTLDIYRDPIYIKKSGSSNFILEIYIVSN